MVALADFFWTGELFGIDFSESFFVFFSFSIEAMIEVALDE